MAGVMNLKRCGTCFFAKITPLTAQDISKRVCWGAPPHAQQVPAPGGQLSLQMIRPVVSVSDDACALYQRIDDVERMQRDGEAMLQQLPPEARQ